MSAGSERGPGPGAVGRGSDAEPASGDRGLGAGRSAGGRGQAAGGRGQAAGDDLIELRGLRVAGRCGVLPEEVERAQPLEFDLDLTVDLAAAGASDDLADTVDYGAACAAVEALVTGGHVALLERLAAEVAQALLDLDPRVTAVEVAARKLRPPVPQHLNTSGVRIRRHRAVS